jgi:NAD(P)-dependent dehydrogenase (short-subunit alcohol dehydrogenase family)
MLLEGKAAVIYGGGGSIGRAMARAFAREGATVHLAGRTQQALDDSAAEIRDAGGCPVSDGSRGRGFTMELDGSTRIDWAATSSSSRGQRTCRSSEA